jgi:hypothetical protein
LETHTSEYVEPVKVEAIDPDCVPDRLDVQLTVTRRGFGTTHTQKAKISELDDSQLKEVVSRVGDQAEGIKPVFKIYSVLQAFDRLIEKTFV